MEEDERERQENQPEPEIGSGPEDEGKEELPQSVMQPVAPGEAEQEQPVHRIQPQAAPNLPPGQPPSASRERRGQFLLGLGIGFIPLVLFFIGFVPNATALISIALILLLAVLIASIICIAIPRVRYIGYGLLTSIPISLVVGSIGCIVIISRPPSG